MQNKYLLLLLFSLNILLSNTGNFSEIVILSSTNVHGEIEPCGWKKGPLGGLARKATIVDGIKSEGYNPIIVDAGNLFFKTNKPAIGVSNDIRQINAEVILESFNNIGCHAFSVGENEFSNGLDYILELKRKANFPFLSANIVNDNNELIFDPYVIVEADIRIGFIGLASIFNNSEVRVLNPLISLSNIIDEVRSKSDLVVLLFNTNQSDLIQLQNSDINIDLIIRSKDKRQKPPKDGGTKRIPVYSSANRGKYLNRLDLKLSQSGLSLTDITSQNNIINRNQKNLDRMKKGDDEINLIEFYKDDQATLNIIAGYEKQLELAKHKLENANNTIELTSYILDKKIIDEPEILKIVDRGIEKIELIKGPQLQLPDHKGRLPGDPHHGHNH